jgi:hypothetical protein
MCMFACVGSSSRRAAVLAAPVLALIGLAPATPALGADVLYQQPYEVQRYSYPAPVYAPPPAYVAPTYVERYVEVSPSYVLPQYPYYSRAYVYPPPVALPYDPYARRYIEVERMVRPPVTIPPRHPWSRYPPELDDIYGYRQPYSWSARR